MQFNIVLTAEQISLIGKSLGERPYSEVVGLINSIQTQVDQQLAAQNNQQPAIESAPAKSKK
jgi:hypothetical protein